MAVMFEKLDPIDIRQVKDVKKALDPIVTGPPRLKRETKQKLLQ